MGAIPYESMGCYIKQKNDMHVHAALRKLYRLFGF